MAEQTSAEQNKELVRRYFEIGTQENWDSLDEVLASDYTLHDVPGAEEDLVGHDAIEAYFTDMLEAFPDMTATIEEMVAEADKVAYRGRFTGTHDGEIMGIPPTGEKVHVDSTGFFRIEDGKIVEGRPQMDTFGMMKQLGVIEEPGE